MDNLYELTYTELFLEQLETHENSGQKDILRKIEKLFAEIEMFPKKGTGHPEALLGYGEREVYSRHINKKHRLIYEIFEEERKVMMLSCYGHYYEKKKDKNKLF